MFRNILTVTMLVTVAVIGIGDLLQVEAVDNALIQFATAGVLPGTGIALTPGQMFVFLGVVLLLVLCLLFRKGIIRDLQRLHAALKRPAAREPEQQPIRAADIRPAPPAESRIIVVTTIPGTPGLLTRGYQYVRPRLRPAAVMLAVSAMRSTRRLARRFVQRTVSADRRSRIYMQAVWRFAEPRIRAWDAAIEHRLKRNPTVARWLRDADRRTMLIRQWAEDWRTHRAGTVEK